MVQVAIDSMIGEYKLAFYQLLLGLFALHGSLMSFFWLQARSDLLAVLMTLAVLSSLILELRFIRTVFAKFKIPGTLVTGKFEGVEAVRAGAEAGLRDSGEIASVSHLIRDQSAPGAAPVLG